MKVKFVFNSFRFAIRGLMYIYKYEQNFRIQVLLCIVVILLGIFLNINRNEWLTILFTSLLVLLMECLNTALEKFLDILKPRLFNQTAIIKDIMAGAVLLASMGAFLIGTVVFLPYFIELFSK